MRRERWTAAASYDRARISMALLRFAKPRFRITSRDVQWRVSMFRINPLHLKWFVLIANTGCLISRSFSCGRRFLFTLLIVRSYLTMWILPMIRVRYVDNRARRFSHCRTSVKMMHPASRSHLPKIRNQIRESVIAIRFIKPNFDGRSITAVSETSSARITFFFVFKSVIPQIQFSQIMWLNVS